MGLSDLQENGINMIINLLFLLHPQTENHQREEIKIHKNHLLHYKEKENSATFKCIAIRKTSLGDGVVKRKKERRGKLSILKK